MTYDSKSVTNATPAPAEDRGEGKSIAERDEIEGIIDVFSAMDLSEHSLRREGDRIAQEGAAATDEVPVVNPDPSTEALFTPDPVSEGMHWESPHESPKPTLVTPPEILRTLPEGQPMADAPSPEDIIEWEGSPEWTTHGPPTVPDFIELDPADAGLRRSSRVTSKPTYHINYMVPVSPRDQFMDTMSHIQQLDQSISIFEVRLANASDKLNAASKDGQDSHAHPIAAAEMAQTAQKDMDWTNALLDSKHRQSAIKALPDDVDSLEATILTRILPEDPEFADTVKYACRGRVLLDIKRSLAYKVMGFKHGFREGLEQADGPGFNYYSSVVKLHGVRVVLMRRRRHDHALGIKDVSTAFPAV